MDKELAMCIGAKVFKKSNKPFKKGDEGIAHKHDFIESFCVNHQSPNASPAAFLSLSKTVVNLSMLETEV